MTALASSFFSLDPDSVEAGRLAGESIRKAFGSEPLKAVLVYSTMNHDQADMLHAMRTVLGADVPILGCSTQGVASDVGLTEEGFIMGAMGFGGSSLKCAIASEREIERASKEKGQALAARLRSDLGGEPKIVITLYDSLSGADIEAMISGMRDEVSCPLVGGGAGQPFGVPVRTTQFMGEEVFSHGVVALALSGPIKPLIGVCHGTAATGLAMTVTKSEGTRVLEIGGRLTKDVWQDATGCGPEEIVNQQHMASWALGVERTFTTAGPKGPEEVSIVMIRGAFGFDPNGAVVLQTGVPEGTRVMFHHRTVENVLQGTRTMAADLTRQLHGRSPWAVLGFECGARTYPFLGSAATQAEHDELRATVAPNAPWLGMMAWGEIAPVGGAPAFHNYTYPLIALIEDAP